MTRSKRRLVLAATATVLGIGGVLLPGASAMAATTTPGSQSTAGMAATSDEPTDYYCEWDGYGNWACVWW